MPVIKLDWSLTSDTPEFSGHSTPKVTCLCATKGRFSALRQSISFFLLQDYPNKELLIFNNSEVPLNPHPKLAAQGVRVVNAGDYSDKDVATIYRDAKKHVSSDSKYVAVWDDDDIYLPWHLSTYIKHLENSDSTKTAARCKWALYRHHDVGKFAGENPTPTWTPAMNNFEASMVAESEVMVFEKDEEHDPTGIHPHITWNRLVSWEGFIHVEDLTCGFRYHTEWGYPHTQCGSRKGGGDFGEGEVLRPAPVSDALYEIVTHLAGFPMREDSFAGHQTMRTERATEKEKASLLEKFSSHDVKKFDHVDKFKVWFYWEIPKVGPLKSDKIPPFVELCHETARRHTYCEVVVVTPEMLQEKYLKPYKLTLPDRWKTFTVFEKSDFFRVFMLSHFGGFWMDSDILTVGDLDEHYHKYINHSKNVFPWEYDIEGNLISCCFGCQPEQFFINASRAAIYELIASNPKYGNGWHPWAKMNLTGICPVMKKQYPLRTNWEICGADKGTADLRYNHGAPCTTIPEETLKYLGGPEHVWKFTPEDYHENVCMFVFHWTQMGSVFMDDSKDLMTDFGDASKIFDYALNYKSPHYAAHSFDVVEELPAPVKNVVEELPAPVKTGPYSVIEWMDKHTPEINEVIALSKRQMHEPHAEGGWARFKCDFSAQQHQGAYYALDKFFFENSFDCIIETGTGHGGLTTFVASIMPDTEIHTFDRVAHKYNLDTFSKYPNITFYNEDIYIPETVEKIRSFTQGKKTCWMLDGGNKQREFHLYKDFASPGDILMMHDFARNEDTHSDIFVNKKRWSWWESGPEKYLNLEGVEWADEGLLEYCIWGAYRKI